MTPTPTTPRVDAHWRTMSDYFDDMTSGRPTGITPKTSTIELARQLEREELNKYDT